MFAAIDEQNEEIAATNDVRRQLDERERETWARKAGRVEQPVIVAELRALPPFKRVTGLATQHRVKPTLRAALNEDHGRHLHISSASGRLRRRRSIVQARPASEARNVRAHTGLT